MALYSSYYVQTIIIVRTRDNKHVRVKILAKLSTDTAMRKFLNYSIVLVEVPNIIFQVKFNLHSLPKGNPTRETNSHEHLK